MELLHPDATLPDGTVQQATTRFEYNARGQMTAMILPDGTRNELNYGIAGAAQGRLVEELHDVANLAAPRAAATIPSASKSRRSTAMAP